MLLKKTILILALTVLFSFSVYSADEPTLSAKSAVLINADTLEVYFEKNAHEQHSMASTTKIMTALLAIESGRLSQTVVCDNIATEGTSIGLKSGYKMTLETLVWGMLLESGNDAAKLTAEFISGSEEAFSALMNIRAKEIGMSATNFVTASGLDSEMHYSTAYDMALLGAEAIRNPLFREICSAKSKTVDFIEPNVRMTFSNHNRLLYSCSGVFGIKTGFTKKSGRCLVSACQRNGVTLVAVTLNAGDDWNDHIKLYDYGFGEIKTDKIFLHLPDKIKVYGGVKGELALTLEEQSLISYMGDKAKITQKVYLPSFLYAPIKCGEAIGKLEIYKDGALLFKKVIVSCEEIAAVQPKPKESFIEKIINKISNIFSIK